MIYRELHLHSAQVEQYEGISFRELYFRTFPVELPLTGLFIACVGNPQPQNK